MANDKCIFTVWYFLGCSHYCHWLCTVNCSISDSITAFWLYKSCNLQCSWGTAKKFTLPLGNFQLYLFTPSLEKNASKRTETKSKLTICKSNLSYCLFNYKVFEKPQNLFVQPADNFDHSSVISDKLKIQEVSWRLGDSLQNELLSLEKWLWRSETFGYAMLLLSSNDVCGAL